MSILFNSLMQELTSSQSFIPSTGKLFNYLMYFLLPLTFPPQEWTTYKSLILFFVSDGLFSDAHFSHVTNNTSKDSFTFAITLLFGLMQQCSFKTHSPLLLITPPHTALLRHTYVETKERYNWRLILTP